MHIRTDSVLFDLLYLAYPKGCQHKFTFLPRLRPYSMRGQWPLFCMPVCPKVPCCVVQVQQLLTQVDQLTDDRDYFDKQVQRAGTCGPLLCKCSLCKRQMALINTCSCLDIVYKCLNCLRGCGNKPPANIAEQ